MVCTPQHFPRLTCLVAMLALAACGEQSTVWHAEPEARPAQLARPASKATASNALHVAGNRLVDAAGNPVRLHGVNIPSLEWGNGEPNAGSNPCFAGQSILDSVRKALGVYQVNLIRLPISQDRWWNAVDGQGDSYRATVDAVIQLIADAGAYVDLDLHWSDAGAWGQNIGQHNMPDDNTATVWADLAWRYQNNPAVLFGLYNEPRDVDWSTWRDGGQVTEDGLTYHSPGLAGLIAAVRNVGATNVLIAGGLDWAFDLTGVANGYALPDGNLVYDAHIYPWKGQSDVWDAKVGLITQNYPLLVGEFGATEDGLSGFDSPEAFIGTLHAWLDANGASYSAWNLHPQSTPALISDWCYTPTPHFGAVTLPWL